jgi:ribonuclease-3
MSHGARATPLLRDDAGLEYPIPAAALDRFIGALGHEFADRGLLGRAVTHRSWCAEHAGFESNERLEFLGDAVLGLAVTADLYRRYPDADEGQLSRLRATVVCAPALAEMAETLHLGDALLLGKGEAASGGRSRASILADAMEAVIGAVYLDAGTTAAAELVERLVRPLLATSSVADHKSRLHELVAQGHGRQLTYRITDDGPEHDKTFRAIVLIDEEPLGAGTGRSKKQAEQAAAREAWRKLEPRSGEVPAEEDGDG